MAAGTPFRGLYTNHILHVLNAASIPLVIERRKVMHRAVPLLVDVAVAALASVGLHEVFAGYLSFVRGLRGTRKERSLRPIACMHSHRKTNITNARAMICI